MDVGRSTLAEECLVTQFHAAAGGEHGVGNDERLAGDGGRCQIFYVDADFRMALVGVLPVCTDKGIGRMVKNIQEAFVERQSGAQDSAYDDVVFG